MRTIEGIEIESGVPMPPTKPWGRHKHKGKWKTLLRNMKSGESVRLNKAGWCSIRMTASRADIEIVTRRITETTYRVWKI